MTIKECQLTTAFSYRVTHTVQDDPTRSTYLTLVMVDDVTKLVHVGSPLSCPQALSHLEVTSLVQILLGRSVLIGENPTDQIDTVDSNNCPRCWKTYQLR